MSERLEKLKRYYSSIESLTPDLQEDIPWLIEQAERAQELEKQVKRHKKEKYKCLKKKQRCEQALEEIVKEGTLKNFATGKLGYKNGAKIARQALQGGNEND